MPQSHSQILVHLVFGTKKRRRLLLPAIREELYAYLSSVLRTLGCPPKEVGGANDHVHLFFGLSRTVSIAKVVESVKTSSSKWLKTKDRRLSKFHWQGGYGAFSVSQSESIRVARYVRNQAARHRRITFEDEYRQLLRVHRIAYDDRHLWD